MNRKKVYKVILILLRDLLILVVIGNMISIFTIPRELWSLEIVFRNCMFSMALGYPAWKGMIWITMILEKRISWLKSPIKRLIYQVVAMTLFSGLIIFIGFSIWIKLT